MHIASHFYDACTADVLSSKSVRKVCASHPQEELVRRYERSKSSGTTTAALDKDIKTAALEALFPSEQEQHLDMYQTGLITYEHV